MRYNGFRSQAPLTDWGQRLSQGMGEDMDGGFWQQPQSYPPMSGQLPPEMGRPQFDQEQYAPFKPTSFNGRPQAFDTGAYGQHPVVDELGSPYAQNPFKGGQPDKGYGQMPMGGKPPQPMGGKPPQGLGQLWPQKPMQIPRGGWGW